VDLIHEGLATQLEQISLPNGTEMARHFAIQQSKLLVNGPLDRFPSLEKALGSRLFFVELEASREPSLRRVITLQVQVQSA
jgi:hypothetical protein